MDINELNHDYQPQRPFVAPALLLGIFSIIASVLCCWTVYLPFILASLAIIFAFLSKGSSPQMQPNAKIGLILGSISIVITACLILFSFYTVFTNPDLLKDVQSTYESIYGEPLNMDILQNF